jgi:hypothetical protein
MLNRPNWLNRHNIIITTIIGAIIYGLITMTLSLSEFYAKRRAHPYFFGGDLFTGIQGDQGSEKYIGYLTDRNINDDAVSMRFTQAQYTLAPVVLDFNNPDHRLLILDFQDVSKAVETARRLSLRPLKRSPQGIILAERPGL